MGWLVFMGWVTSGRIIPTILGKGRRFPGIGPPPLCFLFWLHRVFSCGTWDLHCGMWDLLLRQAGSSLRHAGFSLVVACGFSLSCSVQVPEQVGSVVVACRLSFPTARGILVPRPGIEPTCPTFQDGFFTTGLPGKSLHCPIFDL